MLDAYLAGLLDLGTFERRTHGLDQQDDDLLARDRELLAQGQRLVAVGEVAHSMTAVCHRLRQGLEQASFEQRRDLVETLIDRVVVTDGDVEIR